MGFKVYFFFVEFYEKNEGAEPPPPHFDHSTNPAHDDVDTKANLAPATAEGEGKQLNFVCYNKNTIISMT